MRPAAAAAVVLAALAVAAPRARAAGAVAPFALSLSWVGDLAFSADEGLPPGGAAAALAPVRRALRADLVTGNLEGTLTRGGPSKCPGGMPSRPPDCFAFRAPPSYAWGLRRAGFDLLNLANNHSNDFGATGRAQTTAALRAAHVAFTGRPRQITVVRVGETRVAAVGFAPYPWAAPLLDVRAAAALVRGAARRADVVVAFVHMGAEGAGATHTPFGSERAFGEDRGNPRRLAHALIDAGASLVLGSGPHVLRGIERYRGRLIAYSLGNFAGPHTLGTGGVLSLSAILRADLAPDGRFIGGRLTPLVLARPGLPRLDAAGRAVALVRRLSRSDFASRFPIRRDGEILPVLRR